MQDGTFYPKYKVLRVQVVQYVRKAKSLESIDTKDALDVFQESYNIYCELENLIDAVTPDLHWAHVRFSIKKALKVFLWILSAVVSGIISIFVSKFL